MQLFLVSISDKHNDSEEQEQAALAEPLLKRVDGVENTFKEEKEHRVHLEAKMDRMEEALDRLVEGNARIDFIWYSLLNRYIFNN